MKIKQALILTFTSIIISSCSPNKTVFDILNNTIESIDNIESVYYKQDMYRTNPREENDTIFRYREMYFKHLIEDSIVGVKGHWYMYNEDKVRVIYEDIYDGNRLIRKNNIDSAALIYDLIKHPEFKQKHFWSHNTLYGMQFMFKYILKHKKNYHIERLADTTLLGKDCYQIRIQLEDKMSMPGFAYELTNNEGSISESLYVIDKKSYYPLRMKEEFYSKEDTQKKVFIDQIYYDLKFNLKIDDKLQFNTSTKSLEAYRVIERNP